MERVIPSFKIFIFLLILSLLIIFLDGLNFFKYFKSALFYITNPISFGMYNTSKNINKQVYFLFAARLSAQENIALKEQIGKLLSENADIRKKLAETEAQLSQQKHLDPRTYNLIAARPIGLNKYLRIDKGSEARVKVGEAVIFNDNYIGRITEVSEKAANIQLLMDPDSKVAAFSQSLNGRAKGLLLGQFGTDLLMDKILHEETINVGDLVYSEGTEGFLPRGLILGRVTEILNRENEVFKQAKVAQIFDIRDLELVYVIEE